ncbi:C-reactive protein isoform X1 [Oreochromis niloticus]|uniref:Pentraxin family member n=2 Tax=Oreochromis TaxID=8139 RepID=A0A669D3G8_ORENI|nr:C-reactive protein isoform X1 [Oreochromis niloticus]XP_031609907.2 C-reactive protein-like [Oreochromis aureus]
MFLHCCTKSPDTVSKMLLVLLLVMLTSCTAIRQNLSNKIFTFPQETNTAHVRVTTSRQDLRAVTMCFRSFTDLNRDYSLFSLATPSAINNFLIFKKAANGLFELWARNKANKVEGIAYKLNTWHSICSTWDATSGLMQLWVDGVPSSRKFTSSGSNINGPIIIVLGQEQDTYGGGFDIKQSFVGMMSDVHMWDYPLSPCEIQNYSNNRSFMPGNVLNWNAFEFQIVGRVLIENKQELCQ